MVPTNRHVFHKRSALWGSPVRVHRHAEIPSPLQPYTLLGLDSAWKRLAHAWLLGGAVLLEGSIFCPPLLLLSPQLCALGWRPACREVR